MNSSIVSKTSIPFVIMKSISQSNIYEINEFFWKIFGIWPGRIPSPLYKYYSIIFTTINTIVYNILLTVNLLYTPLNIEALIPEVIFFFTEVAVIAKITMIVLMKDKIIHLMRLVDCKEFQGSDDLGQDIIQKSNSIYKTGWKVYAIVSNFAFFTLVVWPVILFLVMKKELHLPIVKYYFLSDSTREEYFTYCFIYQSIGMYAHMMYNVNVDSFIAGLILTGITQLKVLNHDFLHMQLNIDSTTKKGRRSNVTKLNKLLRHYDMIVKYCGDVQDIISVTMFVQFCMASAIICVSMCGLLMVPSASVMYGRISYLGAMTMQIFAPGWLGTQLAFESQELVNAAYNSDWIPQSESYKRSIRLFIGRANTPIVITGLKILPLSLGTFLSIMKMAYSFFALLRKLQDRPA